MVRLEDLDTFGVGFGTAGLSGEGAGYGFGPISHDESIEIVREAINLGVRVFDSAPIYGFGMAERRLGAGLKNIREKAYIITKTGVSWHSNKRVNMTNGADETRKMFEDSLRRLDTDYIDAVLIHWPDPKVDIRVPFEVLAKAKQNGQIRYLGLSNTNLEEIKKAEEIDSVDVLQNECNIFNLEEVIPLIRNTKSFITSWGTFDKGIATGRVTLDRKFSAEDCRSWAPWWKKSNKKEKILLIDSIKKHLTKYGKEEVESILIALSIFKIRKQGVNCPLVGARTVKDIEKIIKAQDLEHEIIKEVIQIYEKL